MSAAHPDVAPHLLGRRMAAQEWHDLTMLHWRVAPEQVAALLPDELEPDTFDGSAWVSLVPFRMVDVTAPPIPPLPLISRFPETNIRTYVTGPAGPAVWFCSLEVPHPWVPPAARAGLGVPYTLSRMRFSRQGDELRYWSRRIAPAPRGASSLVGVRVGRPRQPDALDRFLVNRWGACSRRFGTTLFTPVVHPPWTLHDAEVTVLHDELGAAAGLRLTEVERTSHTPVLADISFGFPRAI